MKTKIMVLGLFLLSCVPCQTHASLWMAPNEYEQLSDNGKHGDKWLLSWKITAVNPVQPARAYVDSSGSCVITIGGHFRPEFHSDIVRRLRFAKADP